MIKTTQILILISILGLTLSHAPSFQQMTLETNTQTSVKINIYSSTTPFPSDTLIKITIPNQWQNVVSQSNIVFTMPVPAATVSYVGKEIIIQNMFSSTLYYQVITINGITSADSNFSDPWIATFTSGSTEVNRQENQFDITYFKALVTNTIVSNPKVLSISDLEINFQMIYNHGITDQDSLIIELPLLNDGVSNVEPVKAYEDDFLKCKAIIDGLEYTYLCQILSNTQILIQNFFDTHISNTKMNFKLAIQGFRCPYWSISADYNLYLNVVNQHNHGIKVQYKATPIITQPQTISIINQDQQDITTSGAPIVLKLKFQPKYFLLANTIVIFEFEKFYGVGNSIIDNITITNLDETITYPYTILEQGKFSSAPAFQIQLQNQYFTNDDIIDIKISGLINNSFEYDNNLIAYFYNVDKLSQSSIITYKSDSKPLRQFQSSTQGTLYGQITDYSISWLLSDSISIGDMFLIDIKDRQNLKIQTTTTVKSLEDNTSCNVAISYDSKIIEYEFIEACHLTAQTHVELVIKDQQIKQYPCDLSPILKVKKGEKVVGFAPIDVESAQLQSRPITINSANLGSNIMGTKTSLNVDFQLDIINSQDTLYLDFADKFHLYQHQGLINCSLNNQNANCIIQQQKIQLNIGQFKNSFAAGTNNYILHIENIYSPNFSNIQNPFSISTVYSCDNASEVIAKTNQVPTLLLDLSKDIQNYEIYSDSKILGEKTSYYVKFLNDALINTSTDYMIIKLPTELTLDTDFELISLTSSLEFTYTQINSSTIRLNISQSQLGQIFFLQLKNVINPSSSPSAFPFLIEFKNSDDTIYQQYSDTVGIQDYLPTNLNKLEVKLDSDKYQDSTELTFFITNSLLIEAQSKITLTIPTSLQLGNIQYQLLEALANTNVAIQQINNQLVISNLPQIVGNSNLVIVFHNIQNPATTDSIPSVLQFDTVVSFNNVDKQGSQYLLQTNFKCADDCNTCSGIYNHCIECKPQYFRSNNQCLVQCDEAQKFFPKTMTTGEKICIQCFTNADCNTCDLDNPTLCTVCNTGLTLVDGQCQTTCDNVLTEVQIEQLVQERMGTQQQTDTDKENPTQTPDSTDKQSITAKQQANNKSLIGLYFPFLTLLFIAVAAFIQIQAIKLKKIEKSAFYYAVLSTIDTVLIVPVTIFFFYYQETIFGILTLTSFVCMLALQFIAKKQLQPELLYYQQKLKKIRQQDIFQVYRRAIYFNARFFSMFYSKAGSGSIYNIKSKNLNIFSRYKNFILGFGIINMMQLSIYTYYSFTTAFTELKGDFVLLFEQLAFQLILLFLACRQYNIVKGLEDSITYKSPEDDEVPEIQHSPTDHMNKEEFLQDETDYEKAQKAKVEIE